MNAPGIELRDTRTWPQDMTFEAFRQTVPVDEVTVYQLLFETNTDQIKVQKPGVAIPKLKLIFECMFRISARHGFHAMSLRDLCEATGLSMGAMYNYIISKEQLAKMVTEMVGVTFVDINQPLLPAMGEPALRLEALIRAHVYMSELFQPWYYFVYMETKNLSSEHIKRAILVEENILNEMRAVILEGERAGIYQSLDRKLVAAACQSLIQNWYLKTWHFKGSSVDAAAYADFVLDSVHRLLKYDC